MKKLFTIELFHEFDGEAANHLSFFLAETNHSFIKNNRIWIKTNSGLLDCYIEDDLSIQKEAKTLYFWIVCTDTLFYSYTYYPSKINFNTPFFFSTINPTKNPQFKTNTIRIKFRNKDHPDGIVPLTEITGKMPKNAIGCLGVQIDKITDFSKITIPFPVRKTYWQYHLMTNSVHNPIFKPKPDTVYNIVDNDFEQKKTKDKWEFLKMPESNKNEIIYRSTTPLAFSNKATSRLKLVWGQPSKSPLKEDKEMILPFANYEYKMVNKDNKELTPIYIHI